MSLHSAWLKLRRVVGAVICVSGVWLLLIDAARLLQGPA